MERYRRASVESYTSLAVLNAGQAAIFTLGLALMMLMCVSDLKDSEASVGDFVLINATMIQLYQPLNFMGTFYREVRQAIIDIETMFGILSQNPEISDKPDAKPLAVSEGRIVFDDVQFHYEATRPILKGVSFTACSPARRLRSWAHPEREVDDLAPDVSLLRAAGGRITIDGQDILDVTQTSLRAAIGMVPQDTVLFNDTIGYNIRYGRWDASDDEVREAARLAQIDGFIQSVPGGYDAQVGERGLKLGRREAARRHRAHDPQGPPILVLDEATSALDSFTEHEIQEALRASPRGARRSSSRIAVDDRGRG